MIVYFAGLGGSFYFELIVILERFASVLNTKKQWMIKIDEKNKSKSGKKNGKMRNMDE